LAAEIDDVTAFATLVKHPLDALHLTREASQPLFPSR
jgi:hypothetical protein